MTGQFVQDPKSPGSCYQGGTMYNLSSAKVTVTSETGAALGTCRSAAGSWMTTGPTTRSLARPTLLASSSWTYKGPCGVGAVAFLVEKHRSGHGSFDRTRGTLANYVIPGTTPPPPESGPRSRSRRDVRGRQDLHSRRHRLVRSRRDDRGVPVGRDRTARPSRLKRSSSGHSKKAGKSSAVLSVTDNSGRTASKTVNFTVLR